MSMLWFLIPLVLLGILLFPFFLLARLRALRQRVERLESEVARLRAGPMVVQSVSMPEAEPSELAPPAAPTEAMPAAAPRPIEPWPPLPDNLRP